MDQAAILQEACHETGNERRERMGDTHPRTRFTGGVMFVTDGSSEKANPFSNNVGVEGMVPTLISLPVRTSRTKPGGASRITPLWIVAAFVSLTETVLGYAATKMSGGTQVALTIFVMFFALSVAAAFFLVLWNRPYVFYPPSEYGSVDPKSFIQAVQSSASPAGKDVLSEAQDLLKRMIASENEHQRTSIAQNISDRLEIAAEVQTAYELLLIPGYDVSLIMEILLQINRGAVDALGISQPRGLTSSTVDVIIAQMVNRAIVKRSEGKILLTEEGKKLMRALGEYVGMGHPAA